MERVERSPVELRVGGQTYRVVTSASESTLQRLAAVVDGKLKDHAGNQSMAPQALLLAAISLANDLEEERAKRKALEARSREMLRTVLTRIDTALGPPAVEAKPQRAVGELVEVRRKGADPGANGFRAELSSAESLRED